MRNLEKILDEPFASVDQMTVGAIRHRFMKVNEARLERARVFLNSHQQAFLEALPLMLHVNHVLLPGYVSNNTPAGVSHFEPDKRDIRAARSIANAFKYLPRSEKPAIHNISVMGSIGSVAQSRVSDMDFWVCYSSELSEEQVRELEEKLTGIQHFAENLSLEVYFFLMNAEQFRQGQRRGVSGEDCGSAQHYLLLDEFYRTGLMLAGRPPAWWLVPPEKEKYYDDHLKLLVSKQYINDDDVIDFGGIPVFPAGEFIGAGMWQLYKGIESPYKSVIKIMLTEVYASEYPDVEGLSLLFKSAIYRGDMDLDELDPYIMLYRKIEKYLVKRRELERLELLRNCLYLKINETMSRPPSRGSVTWKRDVVTHLIGEWGWGKSTIHLLDSRRTWKVQQVINQRKILIDELNFSYRFLSRFAKDNGFSALINDQDMSLLGRKLYAAFERKSGKIDYINPHIAPNITEEHLSLVREFTVGKDGLKIGSWAVFSGHAQQVGSQPIKRSRSAVELVSWCYFNGLIDGATRFSLQAGETNLKEAEWRQVLHSLHVLYPDRLVMAEQDQFRYAARVQQITLFVNVGVDPMAALNRQGYQRITEQTDALNFSGLRDNLVVTLDQITKNTWNEVSVLCFDRTPSVVSCVLNFLNNFSPYKEFVKPKIDVLCYGATRPQAICKRIELLFEGVIATFYTGKYALNARYILSVANKFYVFQFVNEQPKVFVASTALELLRILGAPQKKFSPMVFDAFFYSKEVLPLSLPVLAGHNIPNVVQVFYRRLGSKIVLYVIDEVGSLVTFQDEDVHEKPFLRKLNHFFKTMASRYSQERSVSDRRNQLHDVRFYEVVSGMPDRVEARVVSDIIETQSYYDIKVIVEKTFEEEQYYTIYCGHKEFSEYEYGDELFNAVAQHIVGQRQGRQPYSVMITDLDYSGTVTEQDNFHSAFYLRQKLALEWQLNRALKNV